MVARGLPENDRLKTIGDSGARVWLYPQVVFGKLLKWRSAVHAVLVALLLIGPWIDIGGHPAIRIDLPARRLYLWGLQFFATDGSYLLFFLGLGFFSVLLMTALFGRAWCGWACPQTVFLESVVRPLERLIEGNSSERRRLDAAPWTASKVLKKVTKWAALLAMSGAIGTTVVAYFLGRHETVRAQLDPFAHPSGTIFFLGITAIAMFNFAWFREQTCVVVCPYGRFQSVLLDNDSIGVSYDHRRGEPRGKVALPVLGDAKPVGDCVDCGKCVQVCPTGIDIRRGPQMECVQCMACIDACDDIMHKVGRSPNLIRLWSENSTQGRASRVLRPRVALYAAALVVVGLLLGYRLSHHSTVELNLKRNPGAPFLKSGDDQIQNPLSLRISNKSDKARTFTVTLAQPSDGALVMPINPVTVPASDTIHVPVFLTQKTTAPADRRFILVVSEGQRFTDRLEMRFLSANSDLGVQQ